MFRLISSSHLQAVTQNIFIENCQCLAKYEISIPLFTTVYQDIKYEM